MNTATRVLLRSGAGAMLAQGSLHLQLLQVEWELEKLRYRRMLKLLLLGVPMFICSLLSLGVLVLMYSWDTPYKFTAGLVLAGLYSAGAIFSGYRLQQELEQGSEAFAVFRKEIAADIDLLRERIVG